MIMRTNLGTYLAQLITSFIADTICSQCEILIYDAAQDLNQIIL